MSNYWNNGFSSSIGWYPSTLQITFVQQMTERKHLRVLLRLRLRTTEFGVVRLRQLPTHEMKSRGGQL
jgi:hypothetical protein